jgi:substrate-binding family protein
VGRLHKLPVASENQPTCKTIRLGKIVEGGQFEIVWSSEKPIRPEPYPTSRSAAAWDEFIAQLFEEWDGRRRENANRDSQPRVRPKRTESGLRKNLAGLSSSLSPNYGESHRGVLRMRTESGLGTARGD